jgi:hypothetical protein
MPTEPSAFRLDRDLVTAFVRQQLDDAGQAELAEQVSRLLPFHAQLPNPLTGDLVELTRTLGGDEGLLRWLDHFPGRPQVTARAYGVIALLDFYSATPGVVRALRELRVRDPYPHELAAYLSPDTGDYTLASLGQQIESLLAEGDPDEAVQLALRSLALLADIAPAAAELDHRADGLADQAGLQRKALCDVDTP